MDYTLEKAHQELCTFLGVDNIKDRPELILEYYNTQVNRYYLNQLVDAVKTLKPLQ